MWVYAGKGQKEQSKGRELWLGENKKPPGMCNVKGDGKDGKLHMELTSLQQGRQVGVNTGIHTTTVFPDP